MRKEKIGNILDIYSHINKWRILSVMILLNVSLLFIFSLSITYFEGDEVFDLDFLSGESLISIFFTVVIFAPIIETLFFQWAIIESVFYIFRKLNLQNSILMSVLISGVAFGISHSYNIYYIGVTVIMGILYGFFYFIAKKSRDLNPFWTVTAIHSISNLIGFIIDDWLELM